MVEEGHPCERSYHDSATSRSWAAGRDHEAGRARHKTGQQQLRPRRWWTFAGHCGKASWPAVRA